LELAIPNIESTEDEIESKEGIFIFEPNLDELVKSVSAKLRYALFRQQILDSRLALYTAQMIAMQTAAENAKELLLDLRHEYNKARRKLIDKKIQEVQAGRTLWA
jgi:F0F1-type ATP synthase gamma subunit